jgi:hypothetical protein
LAGARGVVEDDDVAAGEAARGAAPFPFPVRDGGGLTAALAALVPVVAAAGDATPADIAGDSIGAGGACPAGGDAGDGLTVALAVAGAFAAPGAAAAAGSFVPVRTVTLTAAGAGLSAPAAFPRSLPLGG